MAGIGPCKLKPSGIGQIVPKVVALALADRVGAFGSNHRDRTANPELLTGFGKIPTNFDDRAMAEISYFLTAAIGHKLQNGARVGLRWLDYRLRWLDYRLHWLDYRLDYRLRWLDYRLRWLDYRLDYRLRWLDYRLNHRLTAWGGITWRVPETPKDHRATLGPTRPVHSGKLNKTAVGLGTVAVECALEQSTPRGDRGRQGGGRGHGSGLSRQRGNRFSWNRCDRDNPPITAPMTECACPIALDCS